MPSTRPLPAIAVALLVVLSGCSMLDCGSKPSAPAGVDADSEDAAEDAPDYHEFVYGSFTDGSPFNATVTVTKDGDVVARETVESAGNGTYETLGRVTEPGEYEVTVNTTIPAAGGGNMSDRFTVNAAAGNATVIGVDYLGIEHETLELPREQLAKSVTGTVFSDSVNATVTVYYRGELVNRSRVTIDGEARSLPAPNSTGVYWVRVSTDEGERAGLFVLSAGEMISANLRSDGRIRCLSETHGSYCT